MTTETKTAEQEPRFVDLEGIQTLEEEYGCDPWDDANFGKHHASKEPDPRRVVWGRAW